LGHNLINIPIYLYALLCGVFGFLWLMQLLQKPRKSQNFLSFSILVAARNEALNIERLISSIIALNYPKENFELIIVDDHSEDDTRILAETALSKSGISYRIIVNDLEIGSPKKRAITKAISLAQNEHIICTDADCEVPPNWLLTFNSIYEEEGAMFISGPVTFFNQTNGSFGSKIWNKLQVVEFASLVGAGAAALWLKKPNMCSGANISYTKTAFNAVKGYEGNEQIASGDDEFLMHKIASTFPQKVLFNANNNGLVLTNDQVDWRSFYDQRKRWASKWTFYNSLTPMLLAVFVFAINLTTIWAIISFDTDTLAIRWIAEFLFLLPVLVFLKKWENIWIILPLQFIYPFYVLIFGLSSLSKDTYSWKGRKLT
jgi:glycosyltransferase involved in cell wall biosynthesis